MLWNLIAPATRHLLLADRAVYRTFLDNYCDALSASSEAHWHVTHWEDHTIVRSNGDAMINLKIRMRADSHASRFFQMDFGAARDGLEWQDMKHVKAAIEVRADGPRWYSTTRWLPNGKLQVAVHFCSTLPSIGNELQVRCTVSWPGRDRALMSGAPDLFMYYWVYPVPYLRAVLELPRGCRVRRELIALNPADDNYSFSVKDSVVELIVHEIAARHRLGMRLQLIQTS